MIRSICLLAAGVSLAALTVASVQAADLIVDTVVEPGVVDVSGSWDGVYVGVFGGYVTGDWDMDGTTDFEDSLDGFLVGATLGADFTLSEGLVVGVVGDIAWTNAGNDPDNFGNDEVNLTWLGSLRGRVGFDGGAFLPYLTGGVALAGGEVVETTGDIADTAVHIGWTVGAGVEFAVSEEVSVDLQYRYSDYGFADYEISGAPYEVDHNTHQVTAGVNWRF